MKNYAQMKSRKRKRLYLLPFLLCVCLIFTGFPSNGGALSALAAASSSVTSDIYWCITSENGLIISSDEADTSAGSTKGSFSGESCFTSWGEEAPWSGFARDVKSVIVKGHVAPANTQRWFVYMMNCTAMDLRGLDTSSVKSMRYMFCVCSSLTELDLSGWNTGNVTDMAYMFASCESLTELDISGWNTGKVADMSSMFTGCKSLTELELSGWNTSEVQNMSSMFRDCSGLTDVDLSGWNTGKVTDMMDMFSFCTNLEELDLSGFDTAAVNGMRNMFYSAGIKKLKISQTLAESIGKYDTGLKNLYKAGGSGADDGYRADDDGKITGLNAGEFTPKHEYVYSANYNFLEESCANGCGHYVTATLAIDSKADCTYTGSEIKPGIVTYSGDWAGDKPQITYKDNIDAGTATACLTIGDATATKKFTINRQELAGAAVTLDDAILTYNGCEQTKTVRSVVVNGRTLLEDTDYIVTGDKGTNVGEYTLTIEAKENGNYTGKETANFSIVKKSLSDCAATIASDTFAYTGSAVTPAVTVKNGDVTVPENDYTVTYTNNVNLGKAQIMITAKADSNYAGSISMTFHIAYGPLPDGRKLTDYVTISPEPVNGWYNEDITLAPKMDSCIGISESPANLTNGSSVAISMETGADGGTKTIYIKDKDGVIYQTDFAYKLDKTLSDAGNVSTDVSSGENVPKTELAASAKEPVDTNKVDSPKTGDTMPITRCAALAAMAGLSCLMLLIAGRKRAKRR